MIVLCQIILGEDHKNSLLASENLADILNWKKSLGAELSQEELHQLCQSLVSCVDGPEAVTSCVEFLKAIGTRCSPSIESFLLLLFALMSCPSVDDASQLAILEVLRSIIFTDMYGQVMSAPSYLIRFLGIVEDWKKTPERLADLLTLNESVLTSKTCIPTFINCGGVPLFTGLAKEFDQEVLLTPVFSVLAGALSSKNAVPIFLNSKCMDRVHDVMERFRENSKLQVACCHVLLYVATTRGGVTYVMQSKCYETAIVSLEPVDDEYMEVCSNLFSMLTRDPVNHYKLVDVGVIQALLRILGEQSADEIAEPALVAVKNLIQNPEIVPKFTEEANLTALCASFSHIRGQAHAILCDVLVQILGAVKEFPSPLSETVTDTIVSLTGETAQDLATMHVLLMILKNASCTEENREALLQSGFVQMIFILTNDFISNRDLVLLFLTTFQPFLQDALFARAVVECEMAKVVVDVMTRYTTVMPIQSVGIKTLLSVAQHIPSGIVALEATVVCIRCIQLCISDEPIVLDGCSTLLSMVDDPVEETAVISRQNVVANGGLEPFYTTLQRYPKNASIVSVVLRALTCLADGSSDVNRIASTSYLRTLMMASTQTGIFPSST